MKYVAAGIIALVLLFACIALAPTAHAAGLVDHVYAGAQGAWPSGPSIPWSADVEVGGSASSSLSPHISLTGEAFWGLSHSYLRGSGGPLITVSDVTNPNLSMGLGIVYRVCSVRAMGPNEWAPVVKVGWRPSPVKWPNFLVGGSSSLGLTSSNTLTTIGARYLLPILK